MERRKDLWAVAGLRVWRLRMGIGLEFPLRCGLGLQFVVFGSNFVNLWLCDFVLLWCILKSRSKCNPIVCIDIVILEST